MAGAVGRIARSNLLTMDVTATARDAFKAKFPEKYEEKVSKRIRQCVVCLKDGEIVKKKFCRPCFNARSCGRCGAMNQGSGAAARPECLFDVFPWGPHRHAWLCGA